MVSFAALVHLADAALVFPAAAAISASLLARRAWRMAFWWSFLFALGIGLVGASKVAWLGWGAGLPALGFEAVSGHATGATALFPTLFFLLLQRGTRPLRAAGTGLGIALGLTIGVLLVVLREHSLAEAAAGCVLGLAVSLAAIRLAGQLPPGQPLRGLLSFGVIFGAGAWIMQQAMLGQWLVRIAILLSGNEQPTAWAPR